MPDDVVIRPYRARTSAAGSCVELLEDIRGDLAHLLEWSAEMLELPPPLP